MKHTETIANWERRQRQKKRRIKLLGWTFLLMALASSTFAYCSQTEWIRQYISVTPTEQEAFYMMSLVISFMGIFCLNAIKNKL